MEVKPNPEIFFMTVSDNIRLVKEMASGSIGMATASAGLNALDVVKVRMQTNPGVYKSMAVCASVSVRDAGGILRGLIMPGLTATVIRDVLNGAFRVGLYKEFERLLSPVLSGSPLLVQKLVTGCVVGSLGAGLWSHTDLVKTRMQTAPSDSSLTTFGCYRSIVTEQGWRALYRGVGPNMVRASIITTCHVGTYDYSKNLLTQEYGIPESPMTWTICGFLSAIITTTASAPIDLIRNKMMLTSAAKTSSFSIALHEVKERGLLGLFRGWLPSFYRFGPHFTLSWPLIELARTRIFKLDPF